VNWLAKISGVLGLMLVADPSIVLDSLYLAIRHLYIDVAEFWCSG
jgi:hypothetical protein